MEVLGLQFVLGVAVGVLSFGLGLLIFRPRGEFMDLRIQFGARDRWKVVGKWAGATGAFFGSRRFKDPADAEAEAKRIAKARYRYLGEAR